MEFDMDSRLQFIPEDSRDQNFIHLGQFFNPCPKKGIQNAFPLFTHALACPGSQGFLQQELNLWGLGSLELCLTWTYRALLLFSLAFKALQPQKLVFMGLLQGHHTGASLGAGGEKSLFIIFFWAMAERNTGPFLKAETWGEKGKFSKIEKKFHPWMKDWGYTKEKFHQTNQVIL